MPHDAEPLSSSLANLLGTEPVRWLIRTLLYCCTGYNFSSSWISSVTISRWQGFNSEHEHPISTEHLEWGQGPVLGYMCGPAAWPMIITILLPRRNCASKGSAIFFPKILKKQWPTLRIFQCWSPGLVAAQNLQTIKTFLILELSQYRKSGSTVFQASGLRPAATAADSEMPCVCACSSDPLKLHRSELGHWFCSQSIWFSSGITFESDCQLTNRGSNLDSHLNCASWATSYTRFICSQIFKWTVWSLRFFLSPVEDEI